MIYFEERDSKLWTGSATQDLGPGSYKTENKNNKECHNHGKVPFGTWTKRFEDTMTQRLK